MFNDILKLLKDDAKPALGVTEVVAIALACARANAVTQGEILSIAVEVNGGIFKNAYSCAIPPTGETGNVMAAAIGAVAGDWKKGLEVLKEVTPHDVEQAQKLVTDGIVTVNVDNAHDDIYISATVKKSTSTATAVIEKLHSNIVLVKKDDEIIFQSENTQTNTTEFDFETINIEKLVKFATNVPIADIMFLKDMWTMNEALSIAGSDKMGLAIADTLDSFAEKGVLGNDIIYAAQRLTCNAMDARLSGLSMPAMSIAGSGSHGIVCSLPVIAYGKAKGLSEQKVLRALALSCLITIYMKHYSGRLSPLCGCVLGGGSGAAAGIVLLMGGGVAEVSAAINHMAASLTGMVCDGGSIGCALKASTGVYTMFLSAMLAMNSTAMPPNFGILGSNVEQTIKNIGKISYDGMSRTDHVIIDLMQQCK